MEGNILTNVNDIFFKTSRIIGLEKVTVTKITPTGNIRVSDGALLTANLRKKTSDAWDTTFYYSWSQELEDKYRVQIMQSDLNKKLKELRVFELDEESLKTLSNALKEIKR